MLGTMNNGAAVFSSRVRARKDVRLQRSQVDEHLVYIVVRLPRNTVKRLQ